MRPNGALENSPAIYGRVFVGGISQRKSQRDDTRLHGPLGSTPLFKVARYRNGETIVKKVPFKFLSDNGMISGRKLVAPELLEPDQLLRVCRYGYGLEEIK